MTPVALELAYSLDWLICVTAISVLVFMLVMYVMAVDSGGEELFMEEGESVIDPLGEMILKKRSEVGGRKGV